MLLATHCHHIVAVSLLLSYRCCPIAVLKLPPTSSYIIAINSIITGALAIAIAVSTIAVIAIVAVVAIAAVIVNIASLTLFCHCHHCCDPW
jgi:hypothetical protein